MWKKVKITAPYCLIAQSRKNLWDIEFQKILDYEFQKIHGPWISKNSWTMNFKKFMDHEFPKIVGHWFSKIFGLWYFFLFEKFKIFKNLRNYVLILFLYRFCVIFWFCWFCWFFDFLKLWKPLQSWKNIYFSYSKYIILQW